MFFHRPHKGSLWRQNGRQPPQIPAFFAESPGGAGWLAVIAVVVGPLALAGCGDRILDTGFGYRYLTGESVPESQRDAPVRRMSGIDTGYPSLYTVPDRPPPPPGPAERRLQVERLAGDRAAARAADAALKQAAPDLPVPPPLSPALMGQKGADLGLPAR